VFEQILIYFLENLTLQKSTEIWEMSNNVNFIHLKYEPHVTKQLHAAESFFRC
jgi:hypothetical protein